MLDGRGPLAAGQTLYMTLFVAFHDATYRPSSIPDILIFVDVDTLLGLNVLPTSSQVRRIGSVSPRLQL
jgi:hypothetical protein